MKKICEYCQKEFETKNIKKKYCSNPCKNQAYILRKVLSHSLFIPANFPGVPDNVRTILERLVEPFEIVQRKIPVTQVESGQLFGSINQVNRSK